MGLLPGGVFLRRNVSAVKNLPDPGRSVSIPFYDTLEKNAHLLVPAVLHEGREWTWRDTVGGRRCQSCRIDLESMRQSVEAGLSRLLASSGCQRHLQTHSVRNLFVLSRNLGHERSGLSALGNRSPRINRVRETVVDLRCRQFLARSREHVVHTPPATSAPETVPTRKDMKAMGRRFEI